MSELLTRLATANKPLIAAWANRFSAAAARTFPLGLGEIDAANFTDERGNRRDIDQAFLAALLNLPLAADAATGHKHVTDLHLWHAAAMPTDSREWIDDLVSTGRSGPVFGEPFAGTVEVFTESQLCALHALLRLATRERSERWLSHAVRSCLWLIENIQPDNGTNHPWGAHVFIVVEAMGLTDSGIMYADAMLTNCQVHQGKPDRRSALILHDAGNELSRIARFE